MRGMVVGVLLTIAVNLLGWETVEAGLDCLRSVSVRAYELAERQSAQVRADAKRRHETWRRELK